MKARITTDVMGRVTISYDTISGERVTRRFTCQQEGGYVWEMFADGNRSQVCDQLAGSGQTLAAASRDSLIDLIRSEYRAMRRAEKRAFAY